MAQEENGESRCNKNKKGKILLIGAGGVGCEVLKNLILWGVGSITVIDLDTIEVSNLNRQFLFRREHVGQSKAKVAVAAMNRIRPHTDIHAIHGNVLDNSVLSVGLLRQFSCVINALDNVLARSHVNRLCMASNTPLIETGTAGYLGQASFLSKGVTECYDCTPRKDDRNRTYPACTIRNTPSEPAHCVVWAKYLFSQLFGDADPDAEVSPDPDDPELSGKNSNNSTDDSFKKTTRQWAEEISYDPIALLNKLFREDVTYLLRLDSLWKKRKPPTPLEIYANDNDVAELEKLDQLGVEKRDHDIWSQKQCIGAFCKSVMSLRERMLKEGSLTFDKDDDLAVDFITSTANLRSAVFYIKSLNRFSVKSIAGNIIAAIATTNSVIAGCAVSMAAFNVLSKPSDAQVMKFPTYNNIQLVMLRRNAVATGRAKNRINSIFVTGSGEPPNPACYVCSSSSKNAILLELAFDFSDKPATLKAIRERLLLNKLRFVSPELATMNGRVLISCDEEDNTERAMNRTIAEAGLTSGCITLVEDMSQNISVSLSFTNAPGVSFDEALENFQYSAVLKPEARDVPPLATNRKRRLSECNEIDTFSPAAKKATSNGEANGSNGDHMVAANGSDKMVVSVEDADDDCVLVM